MLPRIVFDAATSARRTDDNGYMHVSMTPISKAAVNPYMGREIPHWQERGLDPDGVYYGLRDPAELQKATSTFNGLPLLFGHDDIDAENLPQDKIIGSTGTDTDFDGTYLKNSLTIYDARAIAAVEDGAAKEISCAYWYEPDFTAGEAEIDGEKVPYNFVMRNIRGNHVALVPEGRAGHDVAVADSKPIIIINRGGKKMSEKQEKGRLPAFPAKDEGITPELAEAIKDAVRAVMLEMKDAAIDAECQTQDEDAPAAVPQKDEETPPAGNDDDLTERMKDPVFRAGYEMGVKYGEKREEADPKRIDADHEREGEEKFLSQDSLDEIKQKMKTEIQSHYRQLNQAAAKVRPLVGQINDVMAYDSVADIYRIALKENGYNVEGFPPAAYEGMVDIALANRRPAADATPCCGLTEEEKNLLSRLDAIAV